MTSLSYTPSTFAVKCVTSSVRVFCFSWIYFSPPDNNLRADWTVHSANEYVWSKKEFLQEWLLCKSVTVQEVSQNSITQPKPACQRSGLSSFLLPPAGGVSDSTVVFLRVWGINQSIIFKTLLKLLAMTITCMQLLSDSSCQRWVRTQARLK